MNIRVISILFILLGCASEKQQNVFYDVELNNLATNAYSNILADTLKRISIRFESDKTPSNELFSSIDYLPLETTSESFFGTIDQIEFTDTQIIILDKKTKGVYVFDREGAFLFKIVAVGDGPTEYRIPKSIAYNAFHERIEVLDNTRGIIQRYSAVNGTYMSTLDFGMGIRRFMPVDENEYLLVVDSYLFNNERYAQVHGLSRQLLLGEEEDNKLKIISQHVDYRTNSGALNFSVNQNLRADRVSGRPLVNFTFNDTIYEVGSQEVKRKYLLDFGEFSNKEEWFLEENLNTLFKKHKTLETTLPTFIWDTVDYLYVNSTSRGINMKCFYRKADGTTKCYQNSDFNQAAGAFGLWPKGSTENSFVYVMEPQEVFRLNNIVLTRINTLYPEASETDIETIIDTFYVAKEKWEFLKLAETAIQEDSNPVLVFAKPNFDAYN